jgi:DNA-binding HxlR family transcriptional regulator
MPHVIWKLIGGPRRFGELRLDLAGISAKVLSMRLRELEYFGMIDRRELATSPPSTEYFLTQLGEEFVPVIQVFGTVGGKLKNIDVEHADFAQAVKGKAAASPLMEAVKSSVAA